MGLLQKLKSKLGGELDPKERTEKVNEEIMGVLRKYKCRFDIVHSINIFPLEESPEGQNEMDNPKTQDK